MQYTLVSFVVRVAECRLGGLCAIRRYVAYVLPRFRCLGRLTPPQREALMKTCKGDESKWTTVAYAVLWAERVTIQRATGYSPYRIVHGVEPIFPFDLAEATYLVPPVDAPMTRADLVCPRHPLLPRQLIRRLRDIAFHEVIKEAPLAIRLFQLGAYGIHQVLT